MSNINIFMNDNFNVLLWMYNKKNSDNLVKITQLELAEQMGLSRPTINSIFGKLKKEGYLIRNEKRVGHYYLTNEAIKVIETFYKFNSKEVVHRC